MRNPVDLWKKRGRYLRRKKQTKIYRYRASHVNTRNVLLIHGLNSNHNSMNALRLDLMSKGYQVDVVDYDTRYFDKDVVSSEIKKITGNKIYDSVIGHSNGGRIAAAGWSNSPTQVYAINSPYSYEDSDNVIRIQAEDDFFRGIGGYIGQDPDYRTKGGHGLRSGRGTIDGLFPHLQRPTRRTQRGDWNGPNRFGE